MSLINTAIGTAKNIPIIPKYAPPIETENIISKGLTFSLDPVILGLITLASIC